MWKNLLANLLVGLILVQSSVPTLVYRPDLKQNYPPVSEENPVKASSPAMNVSIRAATRPMITFKTQNGRRIEQKSPEKWALPHLFLKRNGFLTPGYERTDRRDQALEAIEQGITILQDADDQLQTIELLVQKASLQLADGKTEQAENILYEVLHNAHVQSIPSVIFEAKLLSARLLHARGQTKESNHLLKELHNTRGTDAQHAALHYILWQVNGKEEYARVAQKLYQKLSRKTPNIEYQERLRELQATLEKDKRVPGKAV